MAAPASHVLAARRAGSTVTATTTQRVYWSVCDWCPGWHSPEHPDRDAALADGRAHRLQRHPGAARKAEKAARWRDRQTMGAS